MRYNILEHTFVDNIPELIQPGILYVSMEYGTAVHSCCCGCGEEVVTPFTPTDWKMIFDGDTVSLSPSVGNWTLDCRSHYVIKRGRVIEAGPWTDEQVASERRRDKKAKATHYSIKKSEVESDPAPMKTPKGLEKKSATNEKISLRKRIWVRIVRLWIN